MVVVGAPKDNGIDHGVGDKRHSDYHDSNV